MIGASTQKSALSKPQIGKADMLQRMLESASCCADWVLLHPLEIGNALRWGGGAQM